MSEFHRLDPTADARFLRAGTTDPLTRVPFRPTNEVVMCETCGLVSLRETWEALDGCPRGHDRAARWDAAAALRGGDGAATAPPKAAVAAPRAAEPESRRGRWITPLLLAVGVAGLLVLGVVVFGLITDGDDAPVAESAPAEIAPNGPTAVIVSEPGLIEGALDASDFAGADNRRQDLYTFAADSSGRVLSFTVTSDAFYPDLVVETPEGDRIVADLVDEDADSGSRTVAVRSLRGPGLYRVLLTSRQPDATGPYSLRLRSESPIRPLAANGSAVRAELGEFSERFEDFFRDQYQFRGVEGREHTITVRSSAFAPVVEVLTSGRAVRGETGRAGGVVTFVFTPTRTGTHTLRVSSRSANKRGAYTTQLAVEAAPEPEAAPETTTSTRALPVNGTAVRDSIASGDTQRYTIRGRVGDRVRIEVRTDGFTPSLTLVGPDGTRTPAAPDGDRARLRLTLPTAGTYRVIVGATDGGGEARTTLEQEAAVTADDIPRLPGAGDSPAPPADDGGEAGGEEYEPQPIDGGGDDAR